MLRGSGHPSPKMLSLQIPATSLGGLRATLTFDYLAYKFRPSFHPLRFDNSPKRLTELTGSTVLLITVLLQQKKTQI